MDDRREGLDEHSAHTPRRRVRVVVFGMLRLEVLELPHPRVEFEVADLRVAFVVEAVVALEVFAKLGDFLLRRHAAQILCDAFSATPVQRVMKRWIALGLLLLVAVPLRAVGASTLTTVYLFAIAFAFIGNALMRIEA